METLKETFSVAVQQAVGSLKEDLMQEIRPNKRVLSNEVSETVTKKLKENEIPDFKRIATTRIIST